MNILKGMNIKRLRLQRLNSLNSGPRSGKRGESRYGVIERSTPQVAIVMGRLTPDRRVDHKLHSTGANQILNIRAPFMDLQH